MPIPVVATLRRYNHCCVKILSAGLLTPNDTAAIPCRPK
jgi:hypothetical protein